MAEIKRLNYFTYQFLEEKDFDDEQAYHLGMRRRHNRLLHVWGVAEGLQVTGTTGTKDVSIDPGTAIDKDGREIVLTETATYTLTSTGPNVDVYLTVKYHEDFDMLDHYTEEGVDDYTRTTERPEFTDMTSVPPTDGSEILLAKITLDGSGDIASVDNSVRTSISNTISPGSVGTDELADNAVTAAKLQSSATDDNSRAVATNHIKTGAVDGAKIATGSVSTGHLADYAVDASKLAIGAVGPSALGDNVVTSAKIQDGSVGSTKLANDAVGINNIQSGAITESKLSDDVKKKLLDASRIHKVPLLQQTIFSPQIWEAAIDTGSSPYGLAFDGRNLWVSCNNPPNTNLTKIDVKSRTSTVVPVGIAAAFGIAFDGSAYVWVADYDNGDVVKIHIDTDTPETVTNVGSGFFPMGIACSGQHMWVANYGNDSVSKIDIGTGVKEDVAVGSFPFHLAFDGSHMWVPNYGSSTVSKIDVETNVKETDVAVGTSPVGIAFDGACMWVANKGSSTVSKIDVNTNSKIIDVPVGISPWGVAFDGTHIWVANRGTINGGGYDSSISKIDITTNTVVLTLTGRDEPVSFAFDGDSLWVPDYGGNSVTSMKKVI